MNVLVTGITGTLGTKLTQILLDRGHTVTGFSRDEQKQAVFPYRKHVKLILGDIRDPDSLHKAMRNCSLVYHLAALKCIDQLERNPDEAVATNIGGTRNVLNAAEVNGVSKVIFTSTDKACEPKNVYGATKFIAERRVIHSSKQNTVCRYGNVIGSRGSVIPMFIEQLKTDGIIKITDNQMTRFLITQEEAASFVYEAHEWDSRPLMVPVMKACTIINLAKAISCVLNIPIKDYEFIGIRPGEKIHETILMDWEDGGKLSTDTAPRFTDAELCDYLRPFIEDWTKEARI